MSKIRQLEITDEMIAEICAGVQKTFSTMFSLDAKPGTYEVLDDYTSIADISGFVALTQEKIEGAIMISFPKETIFKIIGKIYKKEFVELDKSIKSGVGEITNIIFGVIKKNLNENGFQFNMAIPNVVVGPQHQVSTMTVGKSLIVPFELDVGTFIVTLTVYPEEYAIIKIA